MAYFNAVLLPPSELSAKLIAFAQENFAEVVDGYCLSADVLPHITLCQFKADTLPEITMNDIKAVPKLMQYQCRDGAGQHESYCWSQIDVESENWMYHLHEYVKNKLVPYDVEVLTKNYKPHLTFCRVKADDVEKIKIDIPAEFLTPVKGWKVAIGTSNENGECFA